MRTTDLVRWLATAVSAQPCGAALEDEIRRRFGSRHVLLTSTGRAGMTLLFRAMRRLAGPERSEIIVPSYTCYSVAASAVKAGLRPRIIDIVPATLDFDYTALEREDFSRVLAVVATNLYGFPSDLPLLTAIAHRHGTFVVDDAAQAMGATLDGRWVGTAGDAGLFSFDKGKNVSAVDGGAIVTNSDALASALRSEIAAVERPSVRNSAVHVVKALGYFGFLRPWLYGIPARIPQLGLGRTIFTTDYPLVQPDQVLVALALTMMRRLDQFTETRRRNASALLDSLRGARLTTIAPRSGAASVYLRLPVLVAGPREQATTIQALTEAGIGATGSYPRSLADIPELRDALANPHPSAAGGRDVARRIVTLPTHPFVTGDDIRRMQSILVGEASSVSPVSAPAS